MPHSRSGHHGASVADDATTGPHTEAAGHEAQLRAELPERNQEIQAGIAKTTDNEKALAENMDTTKAFSQDPAAETVPAGSELLPL